MRSGNKYLVHTIGHCIAFDLTETHGDYWDTQYAYGKRLRGTQVSMVSTLLQEIGDILEVDVAEAVSYTHLTLPTKRIV